MKNSQDFAIRVSELRKSKQLSQKEFGEILGVSNKAVSKWETGESMPQMKTIVKMAEFFKISPDELLVGKKFDDSKISENNNISSDLIEENTKLKNQLNTAMKDKNKIKGLGSAVCAILLTVILIIVLYNNQDNQVIHNQSDFIGTENSVVEFGGKFFYIGNSLEQSLYKDLERPQLTKNAVIKVDDKKENIKIYCDNEIEYIIVPNGQKNVVYVENHELAVTTDYIMDFYIVNGDELSNIENSSNSNDKYLLSDYLYSNYDFMADSDIFDICEIYNNKKLVKSNDLTKRFLKDESDVLIAEFYNDYSTMVKLGKLFDDDKGNHYLYSFLDSNVYKLEGRII